MKIAVYAIAKDEEKFVDRWYETAKEADYVCVLDTGSADKTVDKLKSYNCIVKTKIIQPWRFDVARNESLKIIPQGADVLVCLDLDEIIQPGWAEIIRKTFTGRGEGIYMFGAMNHTAETEYHSTPIKFIQNHTTGRIPFMKC